MPRHVRAARSHRGPPGELLESRTLLSSLTEFLAADASTTAPDLHYLARNVARDELPALDRLQGTLRQLLGRQMQLSNSGLPSPGALSAQTINGVPWTAAFLADGDRPLVNVHVADVDAARPFLARIGMQITNVVDTASWQVIEGFIPVPALRAVVRTPGLKSVMPGERPVVDAQGAAANQWETVSGADQYRRIRPANNGSGIDIGVISDSVNRVGGGLAGSQASGDLPAVNVIVDGPAAGSTDEGRAMLELIHDATPGAALHFHAAGSVAQHAAAYGALRDAGVDVIADDIAFLNEPVFQQGMISQAAESVAVTDNVLVFLSAGNRNNETLAGAWSNPDANRYHNFSAVDETLNLTIPNAGTGSFHLHWNQAWGSAATDIDIEIWNAADTVKLLDSDTDNTPAGGGGNPYESLSFMNNSGAALSVLVRFRVVDGADDGSAANGLQLQTYARDVETFFTENYAKNQPGINPNRNADSVFVLGAAAWNNLGTIEDFSGRGPIVRYFDDNGATLDPPITKQYPNFHAADGVATTFPGNSGLNPFFGTSAATPNAAAVAALMLDAAGENGRGDLTFAALDELLRESAEGINAAGLSWSSSAGFGRVSGLAGPLAVAPPPAQTYLELNQLGSGVVADTLIGNSDTREIVFGGAGVGVGTIEAGNVTPLLDPGLLLFDATTSNFITYDYDDSLDNDALIASTFALDSLYRTTLFSQSDIGASGGELFLVNINAPPPVIADLTLDMRGDATANDTLAVNQTDYFRFTSPSNAFGAGTFRVQPISGAFDAVVSLYDAAGALVARSDATGASSIELLTIANGLMPGAEYFLRVGSHNYASAGTYQLQVNFTNLPGGLPLVWTDPVEGVFVPDRFGIFSEDAGSLTPAPFIDSAGETDSYYFGLNSGNSGALSFTLNAIADTPSPIVPVIVVYRADTGALVAYTTPGNSGLTSPAVLGTRYIAVVADEIGTRVGDVRLSGNVGNMTAGSTLIPLNPHGDGSISLPVPPPAIPAGGERLLYRFVPPGGATGTGTITFTPGDGDGEVWVYGDTGVTFQLFGFARSGGPGTPEVVNLANLSPGATYYALVLPQNYQSPVDLGTILINLDAVTGTAMGTKFRDDDRNGAQNGAEPGLAGFRIYFDENDNGALDPLESSTLTAADGTYSLTGLRIMQGPFGARVREVQQAGYTQTAPPGGSHNLFISAANPVVTGVNFGNYRQLDFGDAPNTYKTNLAADGPRHWLMPGFFLGSVWDGELDGVATAPANGDDTVGSDDEDGVVVSVPLVPGTTGRFTVTASMAGTLDAWFDFDRNGAFDAADRVASSFALSAGANALDMAIPAGMAAGDAYARFRLTTGGLADPFGFGDVGEVEDYRFGVGVVAPAPSQPDLAGSSDLGFFNNDNVTADNSPTFSGTAAPSVLVRLLRDGVVVASGAASGAGSWTLTDPGPAPIGARSYTATADAGSGQSEPSPALAVTIDTVPPAIVMSTLLVDAPMQAYGILFGENVGPSIQPGDFTFFNVTDMAPIPPGQLLPMYDPMFNALSIRFPGAGSPSGPGILPDGNYTLTIPAGRITDLAGAGNTTFMTTFYVLAGDANRDRTVDIGDFSILASRFNQTGTFSQGDFDYSAMVDIGDFSILASKFNAILPAADLPRSPSGAARSPAPRLSESRWLFGATPIAEELDDVI